jgi:hypothetical protein
MNNFTFSLNLLKAVAAGVAFGAIAMCSADVKAEPVSKDELKALRAEKKELCLKNPECKATLDAKADARREKAAAKLRNEILALKG